MLMLQYLKLNVPFSHVHMPQSNELQTVGIQAGHKKVTCNQFKIMEQNSDLIVMRIVRN